MSEVPEPNIDMAMQFLHQMNGSQRRDLVFIKDDKKNNAVLARSFDAGDEEASLTRMRLGLTSYPWL